MDYNDIANRIVKTPKLYFNDTGLACYLTGWKTKEVLENGAMNGAFLENFAIAEIRKTYLHNGKTPELYFYRDKEKKEIDLIVCDNNILYPVEIKKKSNPSKDDVKNFDVIKKLNANVGEGIILCLTQNDLPITEKVSSMNIMEI